MFGSNIYYSRRSTSPSPSTTTPPRAGSPRHHSPRVRNPAVNAALQTSQQRAKRKLLQHQQQHMRSVPSTTLDLSKMRPVSHTEGRNNRQQHSPRYMSPRNSHHRSHNEHTLHHMPSEENAQQSEPPISFSHDRHKPYSSREAVSQARNLSPRTATQLNLKLDLQNGSNDVLLILMIEITDGVYDRMVVKRNDDLEQLALKFRKKHRLPMEIVPPLIEYIESNLEKKLQSSARNARLSSRKSARRRGGQNSDRNVHVLSPRAGGDDLSPDSVPDSLELSISDAVSAHQKQSSRRSRSPRSGPRLSSSLKTHDRKSLRSPKSKHSPHHHLEDSLDYHGNHTSRAMSPDSTSFTSSPLSSRHPSQSDLTEIHQSPREHSTSTTTMDHQNSARHHHESFSANGTAHPAEDEREEEKPKHLTTRSAPLDTSLDTSKTNISSVSANEDENTKQWVLKQRLLLQHYHSFMEQSKESMEQSIKTIEQHSRKLKQQDDRIQQQNSIIEELRSDIRDLKKQHADLQKSTRSCVELISTLRRKSQSQQLIIEGLESDVLDLQKQNLNLMMNRSQRPFSSDSAQMGDSMRESTFFTSDSLSPRSPRAMSPEIRRYLMSDSDELPNEKKFEFKPAPKVEEKKESNAKRLSADLRRKMEQKEQSTEPVRMQPKMSDSVKDETSANEEALEPIVGEAKPASSLMEDLSRIANQSTSEDASPNESEMTRDDVVKSKQDKHQGQRLDSPSDKKPSLSPPSQELNLSDDELSENSLDEMVRSTESSVKASVPKTEPPADNNVKMQETPESPSVTVTEIPLKLLAELQPKSTIPEADNVEDAGTSIIALDTLVHGDKKSESVQKIAPESSPKKVDNQDAPKETASLEEEEEIVTPSSQIVDASTKEKVETIAASSSSKEETNSQQDDSPLSIVEEDTFAAPLDTGNSSEFVLKSASPPTEKNETQESNDFVPSSPVEQVRNEEQLTAHQPNSLHDDTQSPQVAPPPLPDQLKEHSPETPSLSFEKELQLALVQREKKRAERLEKKRKLEDKFEAERKALNDKLNAQSAFKELVRMEEEEKQSTADYSKSQRPPCGEIESKDGAQTDATSPKEIVKSSTSNHQESQGTQVDDNTTETHTHTDNDSTTDKEPSSEARLTPTIDIPEPNTADVLPKSPNNRSSVYSPAEVDSIIEKNSVFNWMKNKESEMEEEEDTDFSFIDDVMPPPRQETEEEKRQNKKRIKRAQVMNELLVTERNYVRDLQVLVQRYQEPLSLLLPDQMFKTIFAHTDTILNINRMFLRRLEREVIKTYGPFEDEKPPFSNGEEVKLAELLLHFSHSFKLYTVYISNYQNAAAAMNAARKIPEVAAFLNRTNAELKREGRRTSSEMGYLIIPCQRIPRYRLLCVELLKVTDESEKAYPQMKQALELISEIAQYCNTKNREMEQQKKMFELRAHLGLPNLIQRGRKLVLEENKKVESVEIDGNALPSGCTVYLFSDLLVCSLSGKKRSMSIDLHPRFTSCAVIDKGFSLSYNNQLNGKNASIRVEFTSVDTADEWNASLAMCLQHRRRHSVLTGAGMDDF